LYQSVALGSSDPLRELPFCVDVPEHSYLFGLRFSNSASLALRAPLLEKIASRLRLSICSPFFGGRRAAARVSGHSM
jgi:hypothetical protein